MSDFFNTIILFKKIIRSGGVGVSLYTFKSVELVLNLNRGLMYKSCFQANAIYYSFHLQHLVPNSAPRISACSLIL